ncbi:hypothetical protein PG993_007563 [Apiospora rasikravindrae]|uniref:Uncharacterized protein n=1 Tax=Apiospora rasikravindrae TaxID=990691 RepID=A0ABR1SXU9_9PEZI
MKSLPRDTGAMANDIFDFSSFASARILCKRMIGKPPLLDEKYEQCPFFIGYENQDDRGRMAAELFAHFRKIYAKAIFNDFDTLRAIMDRHEALIRRRWSKKSHSERKKFLKKTWPSIPIRHQPDFVTAGPEAQLLSPGVCGEILESCMWPHLNLEDLALPEPLPLMLSARSSNHDPSCFADVDLDSCSYSVSFKTVSDYALLSDHFRDGFSVFRNEHTAGTYGNIKACGNDCAHTSLAACRSGYPVGEGVLLMQVQARTYNFLVEMCKTLLHDKDPNDLIGSHIPIVSRPPEDSTTLTSTGSLKAAAVRAPYRVPAEMDMGRMIAMVSAKVEVAEEHFHSMREDPAYFADTLREYEEHDRDWVLRRMGSHDIIERRNRGHFTTSYPVANALFWSDTWARALKKLQKLGTSLDRGAHHTYKDLPPELEANYEDLLHWLKDMEAIIAGEMKMAFASTPKNRPLFKDWLPHQSWKKVFSSLEVGSPCFTAMLAWVPFDNMNNHYQRKVMKSHALLEDLDKFLNKLKKYGQDSPVDSYVAAMMSDMAIVAECRRQLALFQPWARHYHLPNTPRDAPSSGEYTWHNEGLGAVVEYHSNVGYLSNEMAGHVLPADQKLCYPAQKERDEEVVKAMQRAENNLGNF